MIAPREQYKPCAPRVLPATLRGAFLSLLTATVGEKRLDIPLKDLSGDDAVMGRIVLPVFGRVTDGILALSQHRLDELTVLLVIWQIEPHQINPLGHRVP